MDITNCTATVKKGFSATDGPFVKELDSALQSIGVHRQQYFGGAFIGNHVHKALKVQYNFKRSDHATSSLYRYLTSRHCAIHSFKLHRTDCPIDQQT